MEPLFAAIASFASTPRADLSVLNCCFGIVLVNMSARISCVLQRSGKRCVQPFLGQSDSGFLSSMKLRIVRELDATLIVLVDREGFTRWESQLTE